MQATVGNVEAQQHKSVVSVFDLTIVQRLSSFGTWYSGCCRCDFLNIWYELVAPGVIIHHEVCSSVKNLLILLLERRIKYLMFFYKLPDKHL